MYHFFLKMKKFKGPFMLLCAAMIWGSSFVIMKNAVDFLTPAVLLFVRFTLASLFLGIMFHKTLFTFNKKQLLLSLLTGVCLFFAYYVQTWGLAYTTPGKNAFLTAVYCVMVPFFVWMIYKRKSDTYHFIAAILCVVGIGFVSLDGNMSMNKGDILTLCGGILYALHIILVQRFSQDVDGGAFTAYQFVGGSLMALLVSLMSEDLSLIKMIDSSLFFQIFYLAFFATAVAMVCQTLGQKYTSECQASLILSLESVFGVLFSIVFYHEVLTMRIGVGFFFIMLAIITSETKFSFLKRSSI